jgi:Uma2 family endonuclease
MIQQLASNPNLVYPESDGKPLADNTIQFGLIMKIQGGIDALFADNPDVFVAGDLLWYPIEGSLISQAPDVMVAFGRPKGDRRSYLQWQEGDIAPQVAFEILSKTNTRKEMREKFNFYQDHGVEEYYLYDPYNNRLKVWIRETDETLPDRAAPSQFEGLRSTSDQQLVAIAQPEGWVSPRLQIRFETSSGELKLYRPDGKRFESFVEIVKRAEQADQRAAQERSRAEQEAQRAEEERSRAEQERSRAEQEARRAEEERSRAEQEAEARYAAISRFLSLGLSLEQVAEALGFSVEEVRRRTEQQE